MSAFIIVEWALSAFEDRIPERCSAQRKEKKKKENTDVTVNVAFTFGF